MIDKLKEIKLVDEENSNFLRTQLLEAKQYLKTDYRLHLKFESKVADHCLKYALSDEKDIYMQMLCDPYADEDPHKLVCSRLISKETGVYIKRYSFSAPQGGKSSADRMAAYMKRQVRDQLDRNKDVRNGQELFNAMVDGSQLNGVSVYLCDLNDKEPQTYSAKIPHLTDFGDFIFPILGGIKAYRYYEIGSGKMLDERLLQNKENRGIISVKQEGGATFEKSSENVYFWVFSSYLEGSNKGKAATEIFDMDQKFVDPESEPKDKEDAIFEDSDEGCPAAYKSFAALLRHMTEEKHLKVFQRYRVEDYALMAYT
uniref:Uncharacterized protein n=1 Tax=Acrobeloides nanus TaxID=290746 RepID=A0A914CWQ7_9BILA